MNSPTLIHHFLESSANNFPDKIALVHEDVRASYSQINAVGGRVVINNKFAFPATVL